MNLTYEPTLIKGWALSVELDFNASYNILGRSRDNRI
jgi:hypothetical protein